MRVLVIGYGSMGRRHAANARALGWEVLVHDTATGRVCDAQGAGFDAWNNLIGCLSPRLPDAAIIATPAATHLDVARQLRVVGYEKALFVEKPLDVETTCANFWRAWPHPTVMVGYNWRFVEDLCGARACKAQSVSIGTWTDMARWPGSEYASPLLECSHDIDLARWLVSADLRLVHMSSADSVASLFLSDGAGRSALLYFGTASDYAWRTLTAFLPNLPTHGYTMNLTDGDGLRRLEESYHTELAAFLSSAEAGTPVPDAATFEDGLAVVRICEEAEKMAGAGSRRDVPQWPHVYDYDYDY